MVPGASRLRPGIVERIPAACPRSLRYTMAMTTSSSSQGLVEFGGRLRKMRKERYLSLVQAATKVRSSKAALSRYERGETVLPMALAERLDELYRADGQLVAERAALADGSWLPRGAFRTRWDHNHPADHCGPIWMRVVPDPVLPTSATGLRSAGVTGGCAMKRSWESTACSSCTRRATTASRSLSR